MSDSDVSERQIELKMSLRLSESQTGVFFKETLIIYAQHIFWGLVSFESSG